jgi:aspartate racemase
MKTIGLLGGTGWVSTIEYYKKINEAVAARLGGNHSAKILLKSIDYQDISSNYGKDDVKVSVLLKEELQGLLDLKPDCLMICCNTLHKYYDEIKKELAPPMPVFHTVELVAEHVLAQHQKSVLLLATQFTMNDGFFARILENKNIRVTIPEKSDREKMEVIHKDIMQGNINQEARDYFAALIKKFPECEAVVLGCTEYPLVVNEKNSVLPIVNPVDLQIEAAVNFVLA